MTASFSHTSVLLQECLDGLAIKTDGIYIDATFGRGGHSGEILKQLGSNGRLIAFDRDPQAIEAAARFADDERFEIVHSAFGDMAEVIEQMGLTQQIDGVLMDLGVSSPQLDDAERGFSFLRDGPLDMRMDTSRGLSAADWLNSADEQDITQVIKEFGEEKFGKRIAHAIVNYRQQQPLARTSELVTIIDQAMPVKDKFKHPATRTFQGIRIYINAELEQLRVGLKAATGILRPGGRLAVISFHSLEDRMVKQAFRDDERWSPLTKKPLRPTDQEVSSNPRSRSAKLRIAERIV